MNQIINAQIDPRQSVASIVIAHSECAPLLQQHRIDFCCKGEQSLESACQARGLSVDSVLDGLRRTVAERAEQAEQVPATMLSNADLVDWIVSKHHDYLRRTFPFVVPLAAKVARVHGEHNPRLLALRDVVTALESELLPHLDHEERQLFPLLLDTQTPRPTVQAELDRMRSEHLQVGELLGQMRNESDEFALPDWACTSYRTLFAELKLLELDVLRHVHLENHVLGPRFT